MEEEVWLRREAVDQFWRTKKMKEVLSHQRSRVTWLKHGDSNSHLFYGCMNK